LPALGLGSLCFDIILIGLNTLLHVGAVTENDDALFPAVLREFVRFHENAVQ
jgi:hypothetical protein